jgi:hypothetical protein
VHAVAEMGKTRGEAVQGTWSRERDKKKWRTLDLFNLSSRGISWEWAPRLNRHELEVRDTNMHMQGDMNQTPVVHQAKNLVFRKTTFLLDSRNVMHGGRVGIFDT